MMTFHGVDPGARHRVRSRDAQSGDHDGAAAQAARLRGPDRHRRDGHERRARRASPSARRPQVGPTIGRELRRDQEQHWHRRSVQARDRRRRGRPAHAERRSRRRSTPSSRRSGGTLHAGARRLVGAPRPRDQASHARPRSAPRSSASTACARSSATRRTLQSRRALPRSGRSRWRRTRSASFRSRAARSTAARSSRSPSRRRTDLPAGATFNAELARVDPALRDRARLSRRSGAELRATVRCCRFGRRRDRELVSVDGHERRERRARRSRSRSSCATLAQRHPRTVLVAFGNPYLLQQVPAVSTYLVAWGGFPVSQAAAARALIGVAPITGRLPISIPPLLRFGAGEDRSMVVRP